MAAMTIGRASVLAASLALGLGICMTPAQAQDFQLRVEYAIVYTPADPFGAVDSQPPYTMCRNYPMTLVMLYTWRNPFQEYVYTEPGSTFWPNYFMQGVSPNPALMNATDGSNAFYQQVDVGLITGPVNTVGTRELLFQGRTSGFFGQVQTAVESVMVETQFQPDSVIYQHIANNTIDMPTRPWFIWTPMQYADSTRLDIACINTPAEPCDGSTLPFRPLTDSCDTSAYCWIGQDNRHQVNAPLASNRNHQYRVLGRNTCGLGVEEANPSFRTAQACFVVNGGAIPDGGSAVFNAATIVAPPPGPPLPPPPPGLGQLARDLRVTVHSDHTDVSDLRISLTKTSPVVAGPLLLMDRPSGAGCMRPRIQAAFADGGAPASNCNGTEPAISGRIAPLMALSSFAPLEGAGTWQLKIEDTQLDGKTGSLLEWCLSTDNELRPLLATTFVSPMLFTSGFE